MLRIAVSLYLFIPYPYCSWRCCLSRDPCPLVSKKLKWFYFLVTFLVVPPPMEKNNSPSTLHSILFVVLREALGPLLLLIHFSLEQRQKVEKSLFVDQASKHLRGAGKCNQLSQEKGFHLR